MKRSHSYLAIVFVLVGIISCQKEPDESILDEPVTNCRLEGAQLLDELGAVDDTSGYVYTNDRITRINYIDYYSTLDYSGDKISQRNFFEANTGATGGNDKFYYNAEGLLSKCENYFSDPGFPTPFLYFISEFTYSGGKLVKLVEKIDTSGTVPQTPVPVYEYQYTYTGNNITRCIMKDLLGATEDTVNYQYDNLTNYYSKRGNTLYADPLFEDLNGVLFPFGLSANNVILFSQDGDNFPISYNLDSKSNLTEFLIGGQAVIRYKYKCQ